MLFKTNFFYDADVADNAGGNATATVETTQAIEKTDEGQQQVDTSVVQKVELPEEVVAQLKEYEELKAWKASKEVPEKSPEQIAKEKELEKVDLKRYAVENNIANDDDFVKFDTLQQKKDADLVFDNFLQDFKEENPDITDEKELAEAAKEEFETVYKLKSENEKAKAKGLEKLAKEANEIRSPFKTKIDKATSAYTEEKELRQKMPEFNKFIETQIAKNAPDAVSYKVKSGEEEIPVEITLTKEDKEAISKAFNTPKSFLQFTKNPEEAEKALAKKMQGWIKENKFDEVLSKAAEKFTGIGVAKGSNVGAENLFGMAGEGRNKKVEVADTKSNQEANKAAQQYRNSR